jgi:hypothetical protein
MALSQSGSTALKDLANTKPATVVWQAKNHRIRLSAASVGGQSLYLNRRRDRPDQRQIRCRQEQPLAIQPEW